ncbi:AraC family transcriptional regulator [Draconibacterium sp.]
MKDKPVINQPAFGTDNSFSIMVRPCIDLVFPYHMHPDFQLNLVVEGKGTRVVGDHSEEYTSGDLVLLGPNLPHYWSYDNKFLEENGKGKAIIIHFNKDFAGKDFINKQEVKPIIELFDKAYRGLSITGDCKEWVIENLSNIDDAQPLKRLVTLINILTEISQSGDIRYLAGPAFENKKISEQELKIKRITNFISTHFNDNELSLDKIANMASMSSTSFSKYFKKQTGQNYIEALTNLRLSEACKLLGNSDLSIAQIAHSCGYNNLSNFNRLFKNQYKCTPKQFIERIKGG